MLLSKAERLDFDTRLSAARDKMQAASTSRGVKSARKKVDAIKAERSAIKSSRRAERRAEGGGVIARLVAAVVDDARAIELIDTEIRDRAQLVISGDMSPADALAQVGEAFRVEADYVIDGNAIAPVLKSLGVPRVIAVTLGWGLEAIDGPLLAAAWGAFEPHARRQIVDLAPSAR